MVQSNLPNQGELKDIINAIPCGIASYRVENQRFIPVFFSDGVTALSGHTRKEYEDMTQYDALDIIYEPDRERVMAAARTALESGNVLDVSYRMYHKDGTLFWIHLNGRRVGPLTESTRFYAIFTGMSSETRLFQSIVNETAGCLYIIAKETYDLLYVNLPEGEMDGGENLAGQKCYAALHGKESPCEFCTLKTHKADSREHEMKVEGTKRSYITRFRELDWNGIPAYVKYVRDVTEDVENRRERERLGEYFQTIVKNLPGGVVVMRCEEDGSTIAEFLSEGFCKMIGMSQEEAWEMYGQDSMAGVHPKDKDMLLKKVQDYLGSQETKSEAIYRLKKGNNDYLWVKSTFSLIANEEGEGRLYVMYHDMTKEREEQEEIRQQYRELIVQHYSITDPNALVIGHCNVTQNHILEIIDHTDSDILNTFGDVRDEFFTGIASLVVDKKERQLFLDTYLNQPSLAAFYRNETEKILKCYVQFPKEKQGRYAQFKVNMVEEPDTGDITGILTVTDITEQTISDRILHQLSVTSYDFVIDLNLEKNQYKVLARNEKCDCMPDDWGSHSERIAYMLRTAVVPKDRAGYEAALMPEEICRRLRGEGAYTFAFAIVNEQGDIRTKNITVSAIDLRLGRVCLVRTDITDSVREQQGMLNMLAYTFELAGFIDISSESLTMYTRQTVLENLPPYIVEHYNDAVSGFASDYGIEAENEETKEQFRLETMMRKLEEKQSGYDFVFPYRADTGLRYKQINVLWGDANHSTVCLVRADVTDMLTAEREAKAALETALDLAEEANRAKSDFLSTMSHDIRTPMNAIMGMTALAFAHMDDRERVEDCLQKISISSKHLLSLINDILDMSKIERAQITLGRMRIVLPELLRQLTAIIAPQARSTGIHFETGQGDIRHKSFYGDSLRISQILLNILGNAVKFTPEGGRVDFLAEEILPEKNDYEETQKTVRYCFTIKDTGIGMSEDFMTHLFEPFTRSENSARVEGTGLGLSITKGLVDLMGGTIQVESRVHQGTTFKVELSCECAEDEPEQADSKSGELRLVSPDAEKIFAGRCFLIAEDNAINAEILVELLFMYGAASVVKTDGIQVVEAFCNTAPGTYDAILMDIQMPRMNGYEATRAIREAKREDAAAIPIIAMTANAFAEDVQASKDAGMDAHVAKPIDIDVLRSTLKEILRFDRRV